MTAATDPDLLPDSLESLRWNWGTAYCVWHYAGDGEPWYARRRDGKGAGLRADSAAELRQQIIADYTADPVPRELPQGLACPSCGWEPERHDSYSRCPITNKPRGRIARLLLRGQQARGR